ncbi:MAG: hypothetical protein WEC15_01165 [Flavobacteriales bacterium]
MSNSTNILKRVFFAALAIVVLLGGVLAFHLYQVTSKPSGHLANVQMGRLDVELPMDAEGATAIKSAVLQLDGVQHCFVNAEAGTITYGYDRSKQTQDNVLAHVRATTALPVTQFVVSAEEMANGCPMKAPAEASFW